LGFGRLTVLVGCGEEALRRSQGGSRIGRGFTTATAVLTRRVLAVALTLGALVHGRRRQNRGERRQRQGDRDAQGLAQMFDGHERGSSASRNREIHDAPRMSGQARPWPWIAPLDLKGAIRLCRSVAIGD